MNKIIQLESPELQEKAWKIAKEKLFQVIIEENEKQIKILKK